MTSSPANKFKNFISSPQAILGSVVLGAVIGTQSPQLSAIVAPLGSMYLTLFRMCVFPILISGIIVSVARLMSRNDSAYYVKRILIFFLIFLLALHTTSYEIFNTFTTIVQQAHRVKNIAYFS